MRHQFIDFVSSTRRKSADDPARLIPGLWRTRENPAVPDQPAHDARLHQGLYFCICHLRRKIMWSPCKKHGTNTLKRKEDGLISGQYVGGQVVALPEANS